MPPDEPDSHTQESETVAAPGARGHLCAAAMVALATAAGAFAGGHLAPPDLVALYLLAIGAAAALFGRGPSLLAAALSVLAYDFFFVPPYFTLAVSEARHLLTFATMFAAGLAISGLTLRVRRQEHEARSRERRTAALYALARDLGTATDREQSALVAARHAADVFGGGAAVLLPGADGFPSRRAQAGAALDLSGAGGEAARWAFEHGRATGLGTQTVPDAPVVCVPLRSGLGMETLAVLAVAPACGAPPSVEQGRFLETFARQAALALERARLAGEAQAASLRARTEETRSSVLSAVSHDLRTPLAAITGAATALRDGTVADSERTGLLEMICEEAERLERLVRNLLDMTRLESGALTVRREWVPVEEIVGAALARLEARLAGRPVRTELPPDLPLLHADPVLLGQAVLNLVENAAKHTPPGTAIDIRAFARSDGTVLEVADRGPGLAPGTHERVFEKFFRGEPAATRGAGLGLAVCRGIVEAHAGAVVALDREGGGALFRVTLPHAGEAPGVPDEAEEAT